MVDGPLAARARSLSLKPGVYLFKDAGGSVLYVGKANSLRKRVLQYFDPARLDPAKQDLVRRARGIDTIVTATDAEALALEATLIQKHSPPYNVRLVDDSSYLYVRVTRETYPQVELVRRASPDGAWYRGPFPVASAIRATLKEARKLFPWCSNPPKISVEVGRWELGGAPQRIFEENPKGTLGVGTKKTRPRAPAPHTQHPTPSPKPCFAYHLGLCPGICVGAISVEEYQRIIEGLKRFLDGGVRDALTILRARMRAASDAQDYERAAKLRDTVTAIERATTPQHAVTPRRESVDVLGVARYKTHAAVAVLAVREGRVVNVRPFHLATPEDASLVSVLRGFLVAYLTRTTDGAPDVVLPEPIEEAAVMAAPLHQRRRFSVPRRGWKRRLLDLARVNAEEALARTRTELISPASLQETLQSLTTALHLPRIPRRIEGYDVSNIQGVLATGSMVVFQHGKERRSEYRKFRMATKGQPNDVAMMKEMLRRRFGKHANTSEGAGRRELGVGKHRERSSSLHPPPDALHPKEEWPLPDLIIVDGGKGQLNAASAVLSEFGIDIPRAALAKREEELFLPGRKDPLLLPRTSSALYLLQRLRDEAHRFTLGYHQLLRKKRMTRSLLEEIPGAGDATRKKLLRTFGSLRGIRAASAAELTRVVGPKLAKKVYSFLHEMLDAGSEIRANAAGGKPPGISD